MERIVDADKLFNIICAQPTISKGMVKRFIFQLQEEVVHCKDCKYGEPGECGYGIDCDGVWHKADWFCADGKRREENEAD